MAGREGKQKELEARGEQRRLSKAELLRPRIVEEDININSLGGKVLVKSMSHEARLRIREQCGFNTPQFDEDRFTMLSIMESIIDPQLTEEDLVELRKQDANVIDEIIVQISMLNMLGRTEELKKESEPTQNSDSA